MGLSLSQRAELGVQRQGKESEMTTATFIGNMIDKYCEVYARALQAGYSETQAHEVVAEFFAIGFKVGA